MPLQSDSFLGVIVVDHKIIFGQSSKKHERRLPLIDTNIVIASHSNDRRHGPQVRRRKTQARTPRSGGRTGQTRMRCLPWMLRILCICGSLSCLHHCVICCDWSVHRCRSGLLGTDRFRYQEGCNPMDWTYRRPLLTCLEMCCLACKLSFCLGFRQTARYSSLFHNTMFFSLRFLFPLLFFSSFLSISLSLSLT
jgi:hypothetical protein